MNRRRFLIGAAALAATAAAGWSTAQVTGTSQFDVVRNWTALAGLRAPLRVAWLTDVHHGQHVRTASVRAWIDAALAEAPDLVLFGGDLVDQHPGADTDASLVTELARLRASLGVLAVWGNHDRGRFRRMDPFGAALRQAGTEILVNRGVGALYTSSQYGNRFLTGWVEGPARGYVSRGLGVSNLPVRINCPAELTILDLAPVA